MSIKPVLQTCAHIVEQPAGLFLAIVIGCMIFCAAFAAIVS